MPALLSTSTTRLFTKSLLKINFPLYIIIFLPGSSGSLSPTWSLRTPKFRIAPLQSLILENNIFSKYLMLKLNLLIHLLAHRQLKLADFQISLLQDLIAKDHGIIYDIYRSKTWHSKYFTFDFNSSTSSTLSESEFFVLSYSPLIALNSALTSTYWSCKSLNCDSFAFNSSSNFFFPKMSASNYFL